jgi:3-deoxy-D-manno-octulosonic-acid transferase
MSFIIGWMLNIAYALLLVAISPVLLYRRLRHQKPVGGWRQKLSGRIRRQHPDRRCLWFHAVSVGEVLQLQKILDETSTRFPDAELLITTTTVTGYDVATSKYPHCTVTWFPFDFTWAVSRALDAIAPDVVVMVELELWPNFLLQCKGRSIPLALINGRIGEKSFRGYSRVRPLIGQVLRAFDVLAVQNESYGQRLASLGAHADRISVTGNIKFDRVESDRNNPRTSELRRSFGIKPGELVFIAGSTQAPEEQYALDAWSQLKLEFPQLRLVLVPRHKERFEEVAQLVRDRGLPLSRRSELLSAARDLSTRCGGEGQGEKAGRSQHLTSSAEEPVLLLDTLGELAACWGLADFAFVGGSLTNRGGQNMLEPAGYGAAVLFGPNTWNFKDITEALLGRQAARVVQGPEELTQTLCALLRQPAMAAEMGRIARSFVAEQQGATARTLKLIERLMPAEQSCQIQRAA